MPQSKGQYSPPKPSRRNHDPSLDTACFVLGMILLIALTWLAGLGRLLVSMEMAALVAGFVRYRRGRGHFLITKKCQGVAIIANKGKVLGPRTPSEYPVTVTGVKVSTSRNFLGTMVDGRYDHIVIRGNGLRAYGESSEAVERAYLEIADGYKKWDALTPLSIGVSSTTRWRQWTKTERNWFIANNVLPEVIEAFNYIAVDDEELTVDQRRWKQKALNLMARRDVIRMFARRTTSAYVISAKRPLSWGSSLKASSKVSDEDIKQSAIVELANQVVDDLDHAGVVEPRYLNLAGIHDFFAEGWMVSSDFTAYHDRIEHGEIPIDDSKMEIGEDGKLISNELFWFKEQPRVGHDWICFDGTNYHRVFQFTRMSPYLRVNTMNLVKRLGLTGSMTLVGATMSSDNEGSYNARMISLHEQFRLSRRERVYERREEKETIEDLKRREDARYESGDTAMGYNVFLAVGAGSIKELDELEHELGKRVRRTPFARMATILGEEWQEDAYNTAVLCVNRL